MRFQKSGHCRFISLNSEYTALIIEITPIIGHPLINDSIESEKSNH
jgi:hypothetical protein